MSGPFHPFQYTVMVPRAEDPADCLSGAWDLGDCGEDWVWSWGGPEALRVSFRRETDSIAFLSRVCSISGAR